MFDSTKPAYRTRIKSAELRANFNGLKTIIDTQGVTLAQQATQIAMLITQVTALGAQYSTLEAAVQAIQAQLAQLANIVPVGTVLPWFKDLPGAPAIPANYVECNGQFLNDPESDLDGQLMPDINNGAQRFLRGGLTSGATGGSDTFATAPADFSGGGGGNNFVTTDFSPGATPIPPYVTAVHIIRVK